MLQTRKGSSGWTNGLWALLSGLLGLAEALLALSTLRPWYISKQMHTVQEKARILVSSLNTNALVTTKVLLEDAALSTRFQKKYSKFVVTGVTGHTGLGTFEEQGRALSTQPCAPPLYVCRELLVHAGICKPKQKLGMTTDLSSLKASNTQISADLVLIWSYRVLLYMYI